LEFTILFMVSLFLHYGSLWCKLTTIHWWCMTLDIPHFALRAFARVGMQKGHQIWQVFLNSFKFTDCVS
jgi:hypothetical protein